MDQGWSLTRESTVYLTLRSDPSPVWLLAFKKTICLITSTIWCEHTAEQGSLQITYPAQERMATPQGSTSPTLFEQWCGFFYVPQELDKWKCCGTGPTVFRPYPRRLEILIVCTCHCKGSTFPSVIWRPWVLFRPGFEPATSRLADWDSPKGNRRRLHAGKLGDGCCSSCMSQSREGGVINKPTTASDMRRKWLHKR